MYFIPKNYTIHTILCFWGYIYDIITKNINLEISDKILLAICDRMTIHKSSDVADSTNTGVIARNARSSMISNIVNLLQEGAITDKDLEGFSYELIERVKFIENKMG